MRNWLPIWTGCVLLAWTCAAHAQDLRVYTVTKDVGDSAAAKAPVISRSLTLFHAGKVYDYMAELREVTIFEPAHKRFTVLNESAAAYAIVSQDQLRRFLSLAEDRARELAGDLVRSDSPDQQFAVELLQFQLRPEFQTRFDPTARRLQLETPLFAYDVSCVAPPQEVVVGRYLQYADALAELNSVLHPQSFLPGPRVALNRELRERKLLPVSVMRRVGLQARQTLVAEHEWKWTLTEYDRQLITHWESQIVKGQVREFSFEQMQRAVLTGKLSQR